jgi:hypothetical protein
MNKPLINRVASSGLVTIKPEEYIEKVTFASFDFKDYLFQGLMLKEKDFRTDLKNKDWEFEKDKILLVYCSTQAIIPMWAYMLVAATAFPFVKDIQFGDQQSYLDTQLNQYLTTMNPADYEGQRVVVKGCGAISIPPWFYLRITHLLSPYVKSLMFGEPCSTVPIFKRTTN